MQGFRVTHHTPPPVKVDLVDEKGRILGSRQVRDLTLLGQKAGYKEIIEDGYSKNDGKSTVAPPSPRPIFFSPKPLRAAVKKAQLWPGSEVRTLISQGPPKNRIDLTIVGDGYTEAEKNKFFDDAKKICDDLFGEQTFKNYLPLFNVHAVFVPSKESGIGDGRAKNTALGLYRHSNYRQAVMPGNAGAARKATKLAPDSDYPILVGNDKFYGGLGGEFAITTAAPLNISTVLRHELGHNFGRVGEEYDGGQVYDGANFSRGSNVPWRHLQPDPKKIPVHTAPLLHYTAPWKNLKTGDWQTKFTVPGESDRVHIYFSSVGFDTKKDVELLIDGKPHEYEGKFDYDRNFYAIQLRLAPGVHTMTLRERIKDGNNIVSKVNIYSLPKDYPDKVDLLGAYGSYREGGSFAGYRPTGDGCLMRDMALRCFCPPCKENMWRNFLREVSLIDDVAKDGDQIRVQLLPLPRESMQVQWIDPKGGVRADLDNQLQWRPQAGDRGAWKVRVRFVSEEVKDPQQEAWTVHTSDFSIQ